VELLEAAVAQTKMAVKPVRLAKLVEVEQTLRAVLVQLEIQVVRRLDPLHMMDLLCKVVHLAIRPWLKVAVVVAVVTLEAAEAHIKHQAADQEMVVAVAVQAT
jgi:hypothetical protein